MQPSTSLIGGTPSTPVLSASLPLRCGLTCRWRRRTQDREDDGAHRDLLARADVPGLHAGLPSRDRHGRQAHRALEVEGFFVQVLQEDGPVLPGCCFAPAVRRNGHR
eukprot:UN2872